MSGEVDDVLQADGWLVSGLATSGSASLLTTSGEMNETLTVDGWDVGDTGSGTIGKARILTANLLPVTALSESGDAVATHSVPNLPSGVTVTGWSLTAGDTQFNLIDNGATADVTVDDLTGVSADTSYTVQATLSAGDPLVRVVTVTFAEPVGYALEVEPGFALEIEPGFALEVA